MHEPLEVSFQTLGEHVNRRERYALDDFFDMEGDSRLSWLLWQAWREESVRKQAIDADEFLEKYFYSLGLKTGTLVIDVSDPDPENFLIEFLYKTYVPMTGIRLTGSRIRDFPCALHARALMSEYLAVRETQQACCHEIDQTMLDLSRNYRRLILPLRGENQDITKLLIVSRILRPVEKLVATHPTQTLKPATI
jgi:hypothetical protein